MHVRMDICSRGVHICVVFEARLERAGLFPCSMDIFDALWGHGVETLRPQQSRQPAMEVQPALKQERTWKQAVQLARAREQRAHGRVRKVATKQSEVLSKAVNELKCRGALRANVHLVVRRSGRGAKRWSKDGCPLQLLAGQRHVRGGKGKWCQCMSSQSKLSLAFDPFTGVHGLAKAYQCSRVTARNTRVVVAAAVLHRQAFTMDWATRLCEARQPLVVCCNLCFGESSQRGCSCYRIRQ